jgi:hypothetical protein
MRRPTRVALALLLTAAAGCAPAPQEQGAPQKELPTVDVTAAPDAQLSTESDVKERRPTESLAGALPGGFPADLPLVRPSSLVEYAENPEGGATAAFDTTESPAAARAFLEGRLRAAGYRDSGGGVWTKPDRRVVLAVQPTGAGARFTYTY